MDQPVVAVDKDGRGFQREASRLALPHQEGLCGIADLEGVLNRLGEFRGMIDDIQYLADPRYGLGQHRRHEHDIRREQRGKFLFAGAGFDRDAEWMFGHEIFLS